MPSAESMVTNQTGWKSAWSGLSCLVPPGPSHEANKAVHRALNKSVLGHWSTPVHAWSLVVVSVQFSCSVVFDSLWPRESHHARPPCPPPTPGVYSNSCPLSRWCQPAISSSVIPFSSCPQSLPASESFPMSQLFAWGGQSIGVSALASVLPKNTQGWSPLEWTGWISVQSKGLSRVFSNTTVQKHQFFGSQLSSQSNSHIHTWPSGCLLTHKYCNTNYIYTQSGRLDSRIWG